MFDPQIVHSGECSRCYARFRDSAESLNSDGECAACVEEIEAEAADDFDDAYPFNAGPVE
jgi:hypothetical protein